MNLRQKRDKWVDNEVKILAAHESALSIKSFCEKNLKKSKYNQIRNRLQKLIEKKKRLF